MKKNKKAAFSLKWGLSGAVALCWMVPILVVVSLSGFLLNRNYEAHIRTELEAGTVHAMEQVRIRFDSALESSKAASYEGILPKAYRNYKENGNRVQLYSSVNGYLIRTYSRDANVKAVFVTFLDQPEEDYSYVNSKDASSYGTLRQYRREARDLVLETARNMDTGITFCRIGEELYMVRNLMDKTFHTYGVLTVLLDQDVLFQSLQGINPHTRSQITVDNAVIPLVRGDLNTGHRGDKVLSSSQTIEVDGHTLIYHVQTVRENLWGAMPDLRIAVLAVSLLVVPLVLAAIVIFYRHVTHPLELLVEASNRVQEGNRGYQIQEEPKSLELQKLTRHFNAMSTELKNQFEKIYLEQQALQEARIRALQSQINPHFLGNTLEIINWEARIAEDDKVSAMIEALSTMLDAAIGRDGRSLISLREELKYVDAYLYIIQQRMGDGLTVSEQVEESLLDCSVPRLILQPLVENAVEHDISRRRESQLTIRAVRKENALSLEVEHDGTIRPEDRVRIAELLQPVQEGRKGHVGIRNLNQRIKLIYGQNASLTIEEITEGRILAAAHLPFLNQNGKSGEVGN